jgi:hypothetical protein
MLIISLERGLTAHTLLSLYIMFPLKTFGSAIESRLIPEIKVGIVAFLRCSFLCFLAHGWIVIPIERQ